MANRTRARIKKLMDFRLGFTPLLPAVHAMNTTATLTIFYVLMLAIFAGTVVAFHLAFLLR